MVLVAAAPAARPRPSFLLVVVDTLRADGGDAGGSGEASVPSYLKGRGVHFTNALAASDWTSPSVLGLLTSRYPSDCGLLSSDAVSSQPAEWTLQSVLRRAGFATAAVVSNPTLAGERLRLEAGFDTFDSKMTGRERNRPVAIRLAPQTTDAALRTLARLKAEGRPWFLWVQYLEPHGPYLPPGAYPQLAPEPGDPIPVAETDIAGKGSLPRYQFLAECRGRNDYAARYKSSAAAVLDEVDRFLALAQKAGYLDDTLIAYTADHGEFLGENDYWFQHGIHLNPAVVHVPLVFVRAGEGMSKEARAVSHLDVMPSALKLLGVPVPRDLKGEDLFAPPSKRRHPLLTEDISFPDAAEVGTVVNGRLLIKSTASSPEAFRIDGDEWIPDTRTPLTSSGVSEVDAEMSRVRKLPIPKRTVPAEEIQKLRALGYLR